MANSKKIYQYDEFHRLIEVYENSRKCSEAGFDRRNIIKCCKGKRKTHKGYVWSYEIIKIHTKKQRKKTGEYISTNIFEF